MEIYKRKLNHQTMQQILDSFVELTGIRAAYFDNTNEAIIGKNKPLCGFCQLLRQFSELHNNCRHDDSTAFMTAEEKRQPHLYKCHMGLYEAIIPIYIKNNVAGFLMLGQVMNTEEFDMEISTLEQKLLPVSLSHEQTILFKTAYGNITSLNMSKIKAAVKMLDIIVQHIINTDVIYIYDLDSIEKAKHFITLNFTKHCSLSSIAAFSGLSPSYLSFLFKRETGHTVTGYIDKCRLDHARELLTLTSKSIKEISSMYGYDDQNYFSRIFKKHEGISPMEFRTKNKKLC